jgi:hypothetical protein
MGQPAELQCHQLRLRDGRLEEWSGGRPAGSIPLDEIHHVRVSVGPTAERPVVQAVIGAALTALGIAFAIRLWRWVGAGGTLVDVEALMLGWVVGGPWILAGALRRGVVLDVATGRTTRRLAVGRGATVDDLRPLVAVLQRRGVLVDPI